MAASTRSARRRFRLIRPTVLRRPAPAGDFDDSVSQRVLDRVQAGFSEQLLAAARAAADECFDRMMASGEGAK